MTLNNHLRKIPS